MIGKQTSPGMNYHLCWLAIMVHNCHIQSSPSSPRSDSSHTTSSPNHPQSNGIVESVVNTTKPLLKKAFKSVHEPQVCFLDHRYTPCWNTKASPLNCWQVHEPNLLCRQETCCLIYPPCTSRLIGRKKMERIRNYYSEKARELPLLKKGDSVRVRPFMPGVPWEKGIVVEPAMTRSYNIEVYGGMLRRKEHTYDMCLSHLSLWTTRKVLQKLTKWINGPDRCINLVLLYIKYKGSTPRKHFVMNRTVHVVTCEKETCASALKWLRYDIAALLASSEERGCCIICSFDLDSLPWSWNNNNNCRDFTSPNHGMIMRDRSGRLQKFWASGFFLMFT